MTENKFLKEIKRMREGETIKRDPSLIAFMVRDWTYTTLAGLSDFCWAGCGHTGSIVTSEAVWLLDELEKFIKASLEKENQ